MQRSRGWDWETQGKDGKHDTCPQKCYLGPEIIVTGTWGVKEMLAAVGIPSYGNAPTKGVPCSRSKLADRIVGGQPQDLWAPSRRNGIVNPRDDLWHPLQRRSHAGLEPTNADLAAIFCRFEPQHWVWGSSGMKSFLWKVKHANLATGWRKWVPQCPDWKPARDDQKLARIHSEIPKYWKFESQRTSAKRITDIVAKVRIWLENVESSRVAGYIARQRQRRGSKGEGPAARLDCHGEELVWGAERPIRGPDHSKRPIDWEAIEITRWSTGRRVGYLEKQRCAKQPREFVNKSPLSHSLSKHEHSHCLERIPANYLRHAKCSQKSEELLKCAHAPIECKPNQWRPREISGSPECWHSQWQSRFFYPRLSKHFSKWEKSVESEPGQKWRLWSAPRENGLKKFIATKSGQ